jgi:hypothetical protein
MTEPPPLPRKRSKTWSWLLVVLVVLPATVVTGVILFHSIIATGITRGFDNMFGDQHLKTAVVLIELHKTRYGKYPDSLRDLKLTGQWDKIHLMSLKYIPSANRDAYYIEVERGWMGKPDLIMPRILERHRLLAVAETDDRRD